MAGFLPDKDAALLAWSTNFNTLIGAAPVTYGLTAPQAVAYSAVHDDYASTLQIAVEPTTRTKVAVQNKNDARKALKEMASLLSKIIQGTSTVTDGQKVALGLNVRKQPAPVPAPGVRPGTHVVSVVDRTVLMNIHDSDSATKRGRASGAAGAYVYSFIGTNYPSDPGLWDFHGMATRHEFAVVFPDTVPAGTQVWVTAAWVNAKGETGPLAVPISTNLQGGGGASAEQQSTMSIAA